MGGADTHATTTKEQNNETEAEKEKEKEKKRKRERELGSRGPVDEHTSLKRGLMLKERPDKPARAGKKKQKVKL